MIEKEIPEADQHFLDWIKRPVSLNKNKAKELIDELEEVIIEKRKTLQGKTVVEKNNIYNQIANRQTQIKYAKGFL